MRFDEIPKFTDCGSYAIDLGWKEIEGWLVDCAKGEDLDLDPDFQRGHVWSESQQIRYVEFALRGGYSANDIYFNCPGWSMCQSERTPIVLVDGKQRLEAVRRFMRGEIRAFGRYLHEFEGRLPLHLRFRVHVNSLQSRAEVLQWYIDLNAGGVVHSDEEINRVRVLLSLEVLSAKEAVEG